MPKREKISILPLGVLAAAVLLGSLACDGDGGSPTEPSGQNLSLVTAAVSVDGTVYNGGTFHHAQGHGDSTRFEARLILGGMPAPGGQMWVDSGRGMMNERFRLYDDGTHGDPLAGDGVYCLEDFAGEYGFHHAGAPHGQYHYDFWGEHDDGGHSNHMDVTVQVAD
jgi:hypothetical protein